MTSHYCHVTTIQTHEAPISCLAAHRTLLYAASVNAVNVYDLTTHVHVDTFGSSSSGSVKSIAFDDDSTCVYTAHQDGKIRVWHVHETSKRHRLVSTLPTARDRLLRSLFPKNYTRVRRHQKRLWIEHHDVVSGLAVAGSVMYSVSWDKSLKIWDVTSGRRRRCMESVTAHDDAVNAVAVSVDGDVYTGSSDGCIRVWGRSNGGRSGHVLVSTLTRHRSAVNALSLNGDGTVLFSGSGDKSIMVWERKGMDGHDRVAFVEALWGHAGAVLCLMSVGDWLVSGSSDRTVRVWRRGKFGGYDCRIVLEGHEGAVKSLVAVSDVLENGVVSICSGSLDGEIRLWEVSDDTNCKKNLSDKFQIYVK